MALGTRSRAVAAGIDVHEYDAIVAGIEKLDSWSDGFRDAAAKHAAAGVRARNDGRLVSARQSFLNAAVWYYFAGAWPSPRVSTYKEAAAALREALALAEPIAEHVDGPRFRGILRLPFVDEYTPLVVLVPGLDGAKEELTTLSDALLARGCATFAMDGPGRGNWWGTFRRPLTTRRSSRRLWTRSRNARVAHGSQAASGFSLQPGWLLRHGFPGARSASACRCHR